MTLDTFDDFAHSLGEVLTHLYDPAYQPSNDLITILSATQPHASLSVPQMIISAIQRLQPTDDVPPMARSRRLYELLACRYIRELTQEETAERLGITPRHLRREQKQAVNLLAQGLWTNWYTVQADTMKPHAVSVMPSASNFEQGESAWRSQVHQELAVLEASDPGVIADVNTVIGQVVRLKEKVVEPQQTSFVVEPIEPGLEIALHPSVLRQLLIVAIQKLAQAMTPGLSSGTISVQVVPANDYVQITIAGTPIAPESAVISAFIPQAVAARQGSSEIRRVGENVEFCIQLPRVQRVRLMVVDDNEDIIHVYRRYLERTRFEVEHVITGEAVFAQIGAIRPDIMLLDVMLPDMDGWEVLTRLHEDESTRTIPIIICSVIRQAELAMALGAVGFIPKPVRRAELIHALEQALALRSTTIRTKPANTATAY